MATGRSAPTLAASLEELRAGAADLGPVPGTDGKSGSPLVRLRRDGATFVLKGQSRRHDWTLRVMGDDRYAGYRVCRSSILAEIPEEIDHAIVAVAFEEPPDGDPDGGCLWTLMRDVGAWLVPEGDEPVAEHVEGDLIDHMAALHAAFWGDTDTLGLVRMDDRVRSFSPEVIERELARDASLVVPGLAREGWGRLADRDPALARLTTTIHDGIDELVAALATTPSTFLHGDWKLGNLGRHEDGRTILLDWSYPGFGPGGMDLAWYLALNAARLARPKEEVIGRYRAGLERRGIDTTGWFERQVGLSLLAIVAMFAWEKALGGDEELAWWSDQARRAAALLP